MDYLEVIIGTIAAFIALRALHLQRYEIIKNGKISALIHSSNLIQQRIDYYSKIIISMEEEGKKTAGHKSRINDELRPLKQEIDFKLLELMEEHGGELKVPEITQALSPKK